MEELANYGLQLAPPGLGHCMDFMSSIRKPRRPHVSRKGCFSCAGTVEPVAVVSSNFETNSSRPALWERVAEHENFLFEIDTSCHRNKHPAEWRAFSKQFAEPISWVENRVAPLAWLPDCLSCFVWVSLLVANTMGNAGCARLPQGCCRFQLSLLCLLCCLLCHRHGH